MLRENRETPYTSRIPGTDVLIHYKCNPDCSIDSYTDNYDYGLMPSNHKPSDDNFGSYLEINDTNSNHEPITTEEALRLYPYLVSINRYSAIGSIAPPPTHLSKSAFYKECQIGNHTSGSIFIIDRYNKETEIPPYKKSGLRSRDSKIIFEYRTLKDRKFDSLNAIESTVSDHTVTTINQTAVDEQPIYLEALDVVVCTRVTKNLAIHPNASKKLETELEKVKKALELSYQNSPVHLIANDPTGVYSFIYVYLMDRIIRVPVTCNAEAPAEICLQIRDSDGKSIQYKTGFEQVKDECKGDFIDKYNDRIHHYYWKLGDLNMATSLILLKSVIRSEEKKNNASKANVITLNQHKRLNDYNDKLERHKIKELLLRVAEVNEKSKKSAEELAELEMNYIRKKQASRSSLINIAGNTIKASTAFLTAFLAFSKVLKT